MSVPGFGVPDLIAGPRPSIRKRLGRGGLYLIAFVVVCLIVVPLGFSVLGGFRSNQQLVEHPVGLPNPRTSYSSSGRSCHGVSSRSSRSS